MSIVSPPPSSSTSFAAPPTALNSPAPISQPNENSSTIASPQSAPLIASPPLPLSPPPPTNTTLPPPASSPQPQPPISTPTPPAESAPPIISPPPTPSGPPASSLTPPPSSSPPASSLKPPSSSTPSSPPPLPPQPGPTRPASSPPPPSTRTPALSPPHSSTLPPALSPPHSSALPPALSPPSPVQNPRTPPAPRSPGNPSPEPPKRSPSSKPPANAPPSKTPRSTPDSPALVPPKNSPPSPVALPPSNSASSSSPPTNSSLPMPTAQSAPPQSSNGAQPSLTPPSPSFPSGVATTSSNSSADKSKDAGDGGIGTGGSIAIGIILVFLLLGIIGAAGWCIWKRKKKGSGTSGGYILPTTLVSSPKSGSASLKVQESTRGMGNGAGSNGAGSNGASTPGNTGGVGNSNPLFTYQELLEATNEFSEHNLLGEGGFGSVYKGCLADGRDVAVKKLNINGSQGEREFRAEVEIISRIHHRHLVSLVGYCIYENGRLLVYDYVPNDTLYFHLHAQGRPVMDWATRVKIAVGAARGIAYLHEDCCPRIIHRDIKSSNILLDNNFDARVADFGLAKLAQDAKSHVTTRVMGTFGYMAPEYASSGKLTEKSDVYSFGVVLLELITGRKPVDASQPLGEESLVEWARPLLGHALEKEEFDQLADPRLEKNYVDSEMFRMIEVAAACVRHSAAKRPGMGQIMRAFDSMLMSDLTNGMKVGESAIYNSAEQSAQIRLFRRMAFPSQDFSSQSTNYSRELSEQV